MIFIHSNDNCDALKMKFPNTLHNYFKTLIILCLRYFELFEPRIFATDYHFLAILDHDPFAPCEEEPFIVRPRVGKSPKEGKAFGSNTSGCFFWG